MLGLAKHRSLTPYLEVKNLWVKDIATINVPPKLVSRARPFFLTRALARVKKKGLARETTPKQQFDHKIVNLHTCISTSWH